MGKSQSIGKNQRRPKEAKAFGRSAVTNGARLFVETVGRGAWARRFRDLLNGIINDLGGKDRLSQAQLQLARRCATLAILCERMEGEFAAGNVNPDFDHDHYGRMTDRLSRCLQKLGLERVPSEDEPSDPVAAHLRSLDTPEAA